MSGPRRYLLLLLLACLTCVVLVQVTLDGWKFGAPSSYGENSHSREHKILPPEQAASPTLTKSENKFQSTNAATLKSTVALTSSKTTKSIVTSQKNISSSRRPEARVQVRRLPLSRNPSNYGKQQKMLINRQERLQEILKQGSLVHGRPTIDPMKSLKSMPLVNVNNVTRIIIITYFRAGSSFIGDLLQQNWKTFYHFEPLHSMTYDKRIDDESILEAFDLFNGIFKCNFTETKNYMLWVRKPRNQFLFAHNLFLWVTCRSNPKTCFNPSFVNAVCLRAPIHVMKVTRLHMRHLRSYLEENPDMRYKVVYLTRDPRGIVSSRWALDWCNGTDCSDPNVLCHEMSEDIEIFNKLQKKKPSDFIKVRYEDFSLNPEKEAKKLFGFLKLPFSASVQKFLKTHTVGRRTDDNNPYSTRRNTTSMAFSWRERFTFKQVTDVQSSCAEVLTRLNHSLITSPNQLPFPNGKKLQTSHKLTQVKEDRFNRNPLYLKLKERSMNNTLKNLFQQGSTSYLDAQSLNNTNIEIHRTFQVLHKLRNRSEPDSKSDQINNVLLKKKVKR